MNLSIEIMEFIINPVGEEYLTNSEESRIIYSFIPQTFLMLIFVHIRRMRMYI